MTVLDPIRWSNLKEMQVSPLAFRWACEHPREDTPSMLLGRATHCAVLEPTAYPLRYAVAESADGTPIRRDARTKAYQDFLASHHGAEILTRDDAEQVALIVAAVRAHPVAGPLLSTQATVEQRIEWTCEGALCQGRYDWLGAGSLIDLKTTRCDLDERTLQREAAKLGYFISLTWYADGIAAMTGNRPERVGIVWVQNRAPFDVAVSWLDPSTQERARTLYLGLVRSVLVCRETDSWPGRQPAPILLDMPEWLDDSGDISFDD